MNRLNEVKGRRDEAGGGAGPDTDEALMLRYGRGDPAAFEELYGRYRRRLFAFVLGFLRNEEAARDVYQEIFLRVIKAAAGYEPTAKFSTWIYRIARNLCIDAHRRTGGIRLLPIDGGEADDGRPGLGDRLGDPGPGPHEQASAAETARRIEDALETLSPEQREVFLLRQEGVAFDEIADIVGANGNTVKSRMRYALEGLRKALEL